MNSHTTRDFIEAQKLEPNFSDLRFMATEVRVWSGSPYIYSVSIEGEMISIQVIATVVRKVGKDFCTLVVTLRFTL